MNPVDFHKLLPHSPAYDLPTVLSKMMHVGMSLAQVITAATTTPATSIGWEDRIGSLQVGREADIAILRLDEHPAG
jgi:dihydroorotase